MVSALGLTACGAVPTPTSTGGSAVTPTPSPASYPKTGHAPDYSWVAGQVVVTRIQGGCTFVKTDTANYSPNGQAWQDAQAKNGDYVVLFGHPLKEGEPREVCPGGTPYTVERVQANP